MYTLEAFHKSFMKVGRQVIITSPGDKFDPGVCWLQEKDAMVGKSFAITTLEGYVGNNNAYAVIMHPDPAQGEYAFSFLWLIPILRR